MAINTRSETLNNLYTSTWQKRKAKIEDHWQGSNPTFYLLSKKGNMVDQRGSRFIECPLEYADNSTFTALGKGGTVALDAQELWTTAYFVWRYYAVNVTRYHTDEQQNSGDSAIFRMVDKALANARNTVINELEELLFTAQAGMNINGLPDLVDPTPATGTVGGINAATYSWWRNYASDETSYPFAVHGRKRMTNCFNTMISRGAKTNHLISDQTIYELYDEEVFEIQRGRIDDKGLKDIGQGDFAFKGKPWTWSPHATASAIYFLDLNSVYMFRDPREWFEMTDWKSIPNQPKDFVAQILCTLNLAIANRRHQGLMHTVSE